jgi:hypothetical protein
VPVPIPVVNRWDKVVAKWDFLVKKYSKVYNLNREVVHTIIILESGGNEKAINAESGASGLMQIIPNEFGFTERPTQAELLDADLNVKWGCQILNDNIDRFASIESALCAYGGVRDPNDLQSNKAQQYLNAFKDAWHRAWPNLALPIVIPLSYQVDKQKLIEVRWYAEEAVRSIEASKLNDARKILLDKVIDALYLMAGENNPNK